ncbi:MAG: acyl-CoA thioesterase [Bacteroidota bacterium]|nr:acyl-CoA thioesterase [Bacteroidota bacterium]
MFELDKNKEYTKESESKVVIRFQDCDPMKHLNNAKYFDYFFNAREDQVPRLYGLEVMDFIKAYDAAWVVYNHQISYLRPAMVGEWVKIKTSLIWYNENTIILEYYMTDEKETHLKTLLWSTMRYVSFKTGKSTPHEGKVLDFLSAVLVSDIERLDFNERLKLLKEKIKKT